MDQVRITRVDGSNVGELSDVLLSLGATCCSVEDADLGTERETELYAGDDKVWHMCDVTAMFPGDATSTRSWPTRWTSWALNPSST